MRSLPKSLFRYRSLSAYSLGELVNQTMWYSSPSTFNDPFDCALTIDQRKFDESFEHAVRVGIERGTIRPDLPAARWIPTADDRRVYLKIRQMLRGAATKLGLCCFSEDPRSILMWAHYANDHKGFCVEYSSDQHTMLSTEVSSVMYSAKLPSISISDLSPEKSAKTVELLWRTKAACWRYEKEWRALAPEGGKSYPARGPIEAIIFGERMPEQDRQLLRQALHGQPRIKFKEAYVHESKFAMCLRRSSVA